MTPFGVMLCESCWRRSACACRLHPRHCRPMWQAGEHVLRDGAHLRSSQFVSSGMIAVLFGLSPLITDLGAALWLEEEALTPADWPGWYGLIGLFLVFRVSWAWARILLPALLALFLAVVSQSLGLVWLKRIDDDSPPLAMTLGIWWWHCRCSLPQVVLDRAWHVPRPYRNVLLAGDAVSGTLRFGTGALALLLPQSSIWRRRHSRSSP